MEQVNEQATRIFSRLIDAMEGELIKIFQSRSGAYMRILDYDFSIRTDKGEGFLYSLAFMQGERKPFGLSPREQIVFIVVNNQQTQQDFHNLIITPQHYECFVNNKFEESISIKNGAINKQNPDILITHILLAQQWLTNIEEQGYLQ